MGSRLQTCSLGLPVFDRAKASCASALFFDQPTLIVELCDIAYSIKPEKNRVRYMGDNLFLISSTDKNWVSQCGRDPPVTVKSCSFCLISLRCNCGLVTGDFTINPVLTGCANQKGQITHLYPINVAAIMLLGRESEVDSLSTSNVYSEVPKIDFPELKMFEKEWENVIQSDSTYQADFKKLAEAIISDETVYKTKADYIRARMNTDSTKYVTFGSYVAYPLFVVSVVLMVGLYLRYRRLASLVAAIQLSLHAVDAAGLNVIDHHMDIDLSDKRAVEKK